jgi:hypothetical protein
MSNEEVGILTILVIIVLFGGFNILFFLPDIINWFKKNW